ncbi:MAG: hypothetical protein MRY32_04250 [Rickettsiales bacterium]|nr:hypothetical protein [Rickettsiales bacterium]
MIDILIPLGLFFSVMIAAYFLGRKDQKLNQAEQELEDAEHRKKVRERIARMSDADVFKRLRDKWMRADNHTPE